MDDKNENLNLKLEIKVDNNEKVETDVPKDKFYIIYILFFFLGLVHFLPWSFFTTATEFWMYKFRNTSINETDSEFRTDLQAQFNATLMITLQISEVAFLFIGLIFGRFIKVRVRLIGILCIIFTLFTVLTAFVEIDTDSWQGGFFGLVMLITAGVNSMNAVFTVTIYTTLSSFPQNYLAPYLAGGGLSRIFTSVLQIISLTSGMSVQNSALVYFCMGLLVIASTLIFLILTGQNRFYTHHMAKYQAGHEERRVSFNEGLRLLKKIWAPVVMMGCFILSANASPAALVVSEGEGDGVWNDIYFIPTITFLLSSVCDLIGRNIGFRFNPKIGNFGWVIFAALRTIIVVPLIMFCNAQPRNHLPVLLPHDYEYIIIIILSGITGGYLISRCSYNIADLVNKEELKDAYHVNMICAGLEMGALSVISIVSVKLL